jgi:putative addiction module killer protein
VFTILRSSEFDAWLAGLKDAKGKARILARLRSAELGNLGDVKPAGRGLSEMRIDVGPGYRVYFTRRGQSLLYLLVGGNKSSQRHDIRRAQALAKAVKE